jgi:hypothetical protein
MILPLRSGTKKFAETVRANGEHRFDIQPRSTSGVGYGAAVQR